MMVSKAARRVVARASSRRLSWARFVGAVMVVALARAALGSVSVTSATGIRAVVHEPAEIAARWLVAEDDRILLRHPRAGDVVLDQTVRWDDLVAFDVDAVVEALESVNGFTCEIEVQIFLLPALPSEIRSSFARRDVIFLAPARGTVDPAAVAYIVTHELGHVLMWAALDGRPDRWDAYCGLRGISRDLRQDGLPHAERPREILAEDLRHLFGGPLARQSGTLENSHLDLPETIPGLRELLIGFLSHRSSVDPDRVSVSRAFPNPCNPRTTVEMILPPGTTVDPTRASLEICDARGVRIRSIQGGESVNDRLLIGWDGLDTAGRPVASGRYRYRLVADGRQARGGIVLIR